MYGIGYEEGEDVADSKFKVGDRVKLNKHRDLYAYGDRGTVKRVFGDSVEVRMDLRSPFASRFYVFPAEYLDWARDESAPNCSERKVERDNVITLKIDVDHSSLDKAIADIRAASNGACIVALVKNGQPLPARYPFVHASVAVATQEAERLAKNNPGQEFAVYQRVAGRKCEVSYEMKEVA